MTTVRRVLPHEYGKYKTHLLQLDDNSKYLRFGYAVKDHQINKLIDDIIENKENHILFCVENDDLEFVGIGHIALGEPTELAFSILLEHQGQGIGNALMRRVIQWCRTHHVKNGHMICLSSNAAIKHLCAKYGMKIQANYGESLTDFVFDSATIDIWLKEMVDTNIGAIDWMAKRTNKFIKTASNLM